MNKILFFDLETTGVNPYENGIHQISGIIEIDGQVFNTFNFNMKPFEQDLVEPEALAVAGITTETLEKYHDPRDVHALLIRILSSHVNKFDKEDKFHLAGYNNAQFDNQFLRAFFAKCSDMYFGSWFWSDTLDVMCLASNHLKQIRSKMQNFKLATVAKTCGIEVQEDRLHDAIYDVELTRAIYHHVNSRP